MSILLSKQRNSSTYKAKMPVIDTDFFDYAGEEDELAGHKLERYITSLLLQRAALVAAAASVCSSNSSSSNSNNGNNCSSNSDSSNGNSSSNGNNSSSDTTSRAEQLSAACKKLITSVKERLGGSRPQVLLPADLSPRLARNIVRMVEGEQGGIRGCAIIIILHDGAQEHKLGKIVCDPAYPTVTLLYLHLNRVQHSLSGSSSQNSSNTSINSNDSSCSSTHRFISSRSSNSTAVVISPGYTLEKRKKNRPRKRSQIVLAAPPASGCLVKPGNTSNKLRRKVTFDTKK